MLWDGAMDWMQIGIGLIPGFVLGLMVAFVLRFIQGKSARELADELFRESESHRRETIDAILESVKSSFGTLSLDALSKSTEEFLKLAQTKLNSEREGSARDLDEKKVLIDGQLKRMTAELNNVSSLVKELEKDRAEKFGELAGRLKTTHEQTSALMQTTNSLREILASTKARGQWGERMAEDVLRLAGFMENVNYLKQKTIDSSGLRPDFTFLLPRDLKLNMDVKFPLDNYMKYVEAPSDGEKVRFRNDFLRDVKARIKEVTSREYVNPEQNTLDYVLLFIPNEHIYAFIHEQESSILDEGIRNGVVLCSPVTLFAVLAVIRQSVDNFTFERTSKEMLSLFGRFHKQWNDFIKKFELLGKRIQDTQKEYETLVTTRRRQLERPLNRIEEIRVQRGLPVVHDEDEGSVTALKNEESE